MISQQDLKIYLVNSFTFAFTFTNVENALKIVLLVFSIIYTIINIYKLLKKSKDADK